MMPETSQQNVIFYQAVKSNDIQEILTSISNDVFDVNFRDVTHDLDTPLMRLCHSSVEEDDMGDILNIMVEKQPDVNLQDALGRTLIMHACIALRHKIIAFSLDFGCHVGVCDRAGKNVFHYGAESGSEEIMAALLKHPDAVGCLKVLDFKGYSAMDLARQRKIHPIVKMISQTLSMTTGKGGSSAKSSILKPLRPAFMKKQDVNDYHEDNLPLNTKLENISNPDFQHTFQTHGKKLGHDSSTVLHSIEHENNRIPSSNRWEEMSENNDNEIEEEEQRGYEDNDGEDKHYSVHRHAESNRLENEYDYKLAQPKSHLLPIGNNENKPIRHRAMDNGELENFSASVPMGLIKPRPLPRVTSINKDTRVNNELQESTSTTVNNNNTNFNSSNNNNPNNNNTLVNNNDDSHCNNALSPRNPTNTILKKDEVKQKNNIFTLRPSAATPRRRHLPSMQESEKESPTSSLNVIKSQKPKDVISQTQSRSKINLSLSFNSNPNENTSSLKQLGPIVSPRRKMNSTQGRTILEDKLNDLNKPGDQKLNIRDGRHNMISKSAENRESHGKLNNIIGPPSIRGTLDTATNHGAVNRMAGVPGISNRLNETNQQRISIPEKRDLQAILSPSHSNKRLLQKRQQVVLENSTSPIESDSGYSVKDNAGKDSLFEEEIFLHGSNDKDEVLSSKKGNRSTKGLNDASSSRSTSRTTDRRASLSLPDLRDMKGCLVMSLEKSKYPGMGVCHDDFDMGDDKYFEDDDDGDDDDDEDDDDDSCDDDDGDDDNADDDKAELDGGDSDNSFDCDLEEVVDYLKNTTGGSKQEIPLPSIQLTRDARQSNLPSKMQSNQRALIGKTLCDLNNA